MKKPRITVRLNNGALEPVTAYDAEQLAECSGDQAFSLLPISNRSPEHHKLYWLILGKVVKATGKWPTTEYLHRDIKMNLGYYKTIVNQFGGIYYVTDSTAMKKMNQQEFNIYFEQAIELLADKLGFDPMELLAEM